jgi:acyl-CoA dehydrogenase
MGKLGFLGLEYGETFGGSQTDFWMTVVFAEELAKCKSGGVGFSIIVHTDMSSPWLHKYGTDKQKTEYMPDIVKGNLICALAITEPDAGSDMARISTTATKKHGRWVVNGTKTFITNGVYGDLFFLAAKTNNSEKYHQNLSQFIIPSSTPGISVTKKLDKTGMRSSDTAELVFDNVEVSESNLLGLENEGFYQLASGLQRERLLASVMSVSAAEDTLADTIGYLSNRKTFGKFLKYHQAIRHKVAELATEIESAKALNYMAAELYSKGIDCSKEVSMAKLHTMQVVNRVAYETVQMHGGYGYIRELSAERFARDYRLWAIAGGTNEMMKEIISKNILGKIESD